MTTTAPTPDSVRAAVAAVPGRIVAAWAAQDADAFAAVFTEEGTIILPGAIGIGREAVREFAARGFAGPYRGTRVTGTPIALQLLGPDAAVVTTRGGVLHGDETEVAPERAIHATWVVVLRDGEWQLAAYQNSPANPVAA
ncbi:MAG: conserved hypothetical protein [uncultured Pseudonocardia sp.]|uniref:SnoaL-like domain-containing protein n=1 Tax=uncultured Pseudonocardia sp. TaxID=211455 RepID=A0A6J4NLK7_9PSEU|nr:MAG: conserved hypothetical protein [uncultured Pseudonocardia sp.]